MPLSATKRTTADPGTDSVAALADRRAFFWSVAVHGSARVLSKAASSPLDRVKVCLQVMPLSKPLPGTSLPTLQTSAEVLRDIRHRQGLYSLWRGAGAHVAGACLGGASRLIFMRTTQMWAKPGRDQQYSSFQGFWRRCAVSYAAASLAIAVVYPLDLGYTCLAADCGQPRRFRHWFAFVNYTVREHGFLSLYRGLPLCLGAGLPFVIVATAVHDLLAPTVLRRDPPPELKQELDRKAAAYTAQPDNLEQLLQVKAPAPLFPRSLLLGGFAGFIAQSITYPLDTLRRRWQHELVQAKADLPEVDKLGILDYASKMRKEGGWRAFYGGFGLNIVKLVPELMVLCGVYHLASRSGSFV